MKKIKFIKIGVLMISLIGAVNLFSLNASASNSLGKLKNFSKINENMDINNLNYDAKRRENSITSKNKPSLKRTTFKLKDNVYKKKIVTKNICNVKQSIAKKVEKKDNNQNVIENINNPKITTIITQKNNVRIQDDTPNIPNYINETNDVYEPINHDNDNIEIIKDTYDFDEPEKEIKFEYNFNDRLLSECSNVDEDISNPNNNDLSIDEEKSVTEDEKSLMEDYLEWLRKMNSELREIIRETKNDIENYENLDLEFKKIGREVENCTQDYKNMNLKIQEMEGEFHD